MEKQVFSIVLAAGSASRFGGIKQLADVGGNTMVARAVEVATDACGERVVVVAGHESGAIAGACAGLPGFVVVNDVYRDGIGSSIAAAIDRLRHVADAVLITLADQPLISGSHLRTLIESWNGDDNAIVATTFSNTNGPPVLFARECFDELGKLQGDSGGRHLLSDTRFALTTVDFEPAAVDVDTEEDLRRI